MASTTVRSYLAWWHCHQALLFTWQSLSLWQLWISCGFCFNWIKKFKCKNSERRVPLLLSGHWHLGIFFSQSSCILISQLKQSHRNVFKSCQRLIISYLHYDKGGFRYASWKKIQRKNTTFSMPSWPYSKYSSNGLWKCVTSACKENRDNLVSFYGWLESRK